VEFAAWAVVLLLVFLLSLFGIGPTEVEGFERHSSVGFVFLLGLCLLIYRLRYGRL
jgi:hypothetical protein